ncbi:MAG: hypothetical protein GX640_01530 [Fibrobacter sp.]|nr:hypothetical protein [Fibrobacter sp.]
MCTFKNCDNFKMMPRSIITFLAVLLISFVFPGKSYCEEKFISSESIKEGDTWVYEGSENKRGNLFVFSSGKNYKRYIQYKDNSWHFRDSIAFLTLDSASIGLQGYIVQRISDTTYISNNLPQELHIKCDSIIVKSICVDDTILSSAEVLSKDNFSFSTKNGLLSSSYGSGGMVASETRQKSLLSRNGISIPKECPLKVHTNPGITKNSKSLKVLSFNGYKKNDIPKKVYFLNGRAVNSNNLKMDVNQLLIINK